MKSLEEVEVLWELEDGRSVWWEAKATGIRRQSQKTCKGAKTCLHYVPGYGHSAKRAHVIFQNARILKQVQDGKEFQLPWRSRSISKNTVTKASSQTCEEKRMEKLVRQVEILRTQVAENGVELNDFKKQIKSMYSTPHHIIGCQEEKLQRLLSLLTYKMVIQLQKPPRKQHHGSVKNDNICCENIDGLSTTYVRATVESDLALYESLACFVKRFTEGRNEEAHFLPDYSLTQHPDHGVQSFRMILSNFSAICDLLGIASVSDRLRMVLKYGKFRGERMMRILGTYSYNTVNDPAAVHVGRGLDRKYVGPVEDIEYNHPRYPILARSTRIWDVDDRRYVQPLHLDWGISSSIGKEEIIEPFTNLFHIIWRRAPDVKRRTWSCEISYPKYVVGKLEISLP